MTETAETHGEPRIRTFLERLLGAMRLDATLYGEVEADRRSFAQAGLVVVMGALGHGIGAFQEEGWVGFVASPIVGLVAWLLVGAVIWLVWVA